MIPLAVLAILGAGACIDAGLMLRRVLINKDRDGDTPWSTPGLLVVVAMGVILAIASPLLLYNHLRERREKLAERAKAALVQTPGDL